MIAESVNNCPFDVKETVFRNLILTGGLSNFKDFIPLFTENLNNSTNSKKIRESLAYRKDDIDKYFQPAKLNVQINLHPHNSNSAFVGAAMIAQEEFFQVKFIPKQLFQEFGESIVRRHFYSFK